MSHSCQVKLGLPVVYLQVLSQSDDSIVNFEQLAVCFKNKETHTCMYDFRGAVWEHCMSLTVNQEFLPTMLFECDLLYLKVF